MSLSPLKIGISIGDLSGVGAEIILKTFQDPEMFDFGIPIVYAGAEVFDLVANKIASSVPLYNTKQEGFEKGLINLVRPWSDVLEISPGVPTPQSGISAFQSLEMAAHDLMQGQIDALVTAPIDKKNIQSSEFTFPGHTEYLADISKSDEALMFLVSDELRVGVATGHVPLDQVSGLLTEELILNKIKMMHRSLKQDFGIESPRIAVLGLNPHAGDNGLIGNDEIDLIRPSIEKAKTMGFKADGPFPADGFFGNRLYTDFDAVLAMYHDQGLIPFKTLAFEKGVNFTAGLPIVRTSPDHGTAYDIAGKGLASPVSFKEAWIMATQICQSRRNTAS